MALAGSLSAQTGQRRYVVASFVGDRIEFVSGAMQTGTRLDPNARDIVDDTNASMDKVVLAAVTEGIEAADRGAPVTITVMPPSRLHQNPETMLRPDGVALPGAVVDLIEQRKATHVVLVTKYDADATFQLHDTTAGRGKVRGLGFYVDVDTKVHTVETREGSRGFIAPFVYVRLSLVDAAKGEVIRERTVRGGEVVPTHASRDAATPWQALSPADKMSRLSAVIRRHVGPATEALVAGR